MRTGNPRGSALGNREEYRGWGGRRQGATAPRDFGAGGFPDDPACGDGEGHRPQFVDRDVRAGGPALDAGGIEAEFAGIALGDLDAGGLVYEVDIAALVAVHLRLGEIELDQVA